MFADAVETAMKFTRPVVVSRKTIGGDLSSGIGAFIVVNRDGWIVTASHIIEQILEMDKEVIALHAAEARRAAIDAERISNGEKRRRKAQLQRFSPKTTERFSPHWCWPGARLTNVSFISGVDIAIGKLDPFDPTSIDTYPDFKDPNRNFRPGTSLCRVGFPFHEFKPSWDGATNNFLLPPEATPIPIFASEGIIARMMHVQVPD
jgi:hypothetical protein